MFDQYRKFPSQQMPVIVALLQIIRSQINAREGRQGPSQSSRPHLHYQRDSVDCGVNEAQPAEWSYL